MNESHSFANPQRQVRTNRVQKITFDSSFPQFRGVLTLANQVIKYNIAKESHIGGPSDRGGLWQGTVANPIGPGFPFSIAKLFANLRIIER